MTCKNHPKLRWSTKEIAVNENGTYNGSRNIFFKGEIKDPIKFYSDMSGVECSFVEEECLCPSDCLIIAPEDKQLEEAYNKQMKEYNKGKQ